MRERISSMFNCDFLVYVLTSSTICQAPSIKLAVGLKSTYFWIKEKVEIDKAAGIDLEQYRGSVIVKAKVTDDGDTVRAGKV